MEASRKGRGYFGDVDAAVPRPADLSAQHIAHQVQQGLKYLDRTDGTQIVVGIKGSGKTDLRRFIARADPNALVLNLNADTSNPNIDVQGLNVRSGRIKNALALKLLAGFRAEIIKTASRTTKTIEKLKAAGDRTKEIVKKLPESIDIDTPFGSISLGALSLPQSAGIVQDAWESLAADVKAAMSSKRGYILIDDVEDVFPGIETNPDFLEGLCRSVVEVNSRFESRLHALLFVKYGVWRHWYENQREYDKVADAIVHLSWNDDLLVDVISRRIAWRQDRAQDELGNEGLWTLEFEFDNFASYTRHFTDVCVSGPRDIIYLCNQCAVTSGDRKIILEDLEEVLPRYSENKLYEIGADFRDVYENIDKFVLQVLRGATVKMSFAALAELIEAKGLLDDTVKQEYNKYAWFRLSDREKLAALMYEIGVTGVAFPDRVIYAIEEPLRTATGNETLVIHPAFRSVLHTSGA